MLVYHVCWANKCWPIKVIKATVGKTNYEAILNLTYFILSPKPAAGTREQTVTLVKCISRHALAHCKLDQVQCDQIGPFIALWATFLSLWQQLFCPNCHIFWQFVKGVKIFHFSSEISFQFYIHFPNFYWSRWLG